MQKSLENLGGRKEEVPGGKARNLVHVCSPLNRSTQTAHFPFHFLTFPLWLFPGAADPARADRQGAAQQRRRVSHRHRGAAEEEVPQGHHAHHPAAAGPPLLLACAFPVSQIVNALADFRPPGRA